ncbi:aspartyl/asparaginyl beta-hydroxylase domain-containing protein [Candidatus Binatia bacterium]|nr:aspartyl/asparaginyl beta-hydroxylase domain-containing protein [Candidatus Binatia bacterium]
MTRHAGAERRTTTSYAGAERRTATSHAGANVRALALPIDPPPADGVLRHLGIDECVRLPLRVDAGRIAAELRTLSDDTWTGASRDPVVQASVRSFFAIGHPRGPRPLPPEDRAPLAHLPYLRHVLRDLVPATPTRAIVARLEPHGLIPIHRDTARFFRHTVRLTFAVSADGPQRLLCDGVFYAQEPGEVWAISNLVPHAVHHTGDAPRVNVLADYLPSHDLLALLARGERGLGVRDHDATRAIEQLSRERYRTHRWRGIGWEIFKRVWRRRA